MSVEDMAKRMRLIYFTITTLFFFNFIYGDIVKQKNKNMKSSAATSSGAITLQKTQQNTVINVIKHAERGTV